VIDTATREFEYRDFSGVNTVQQAGSVTEETVVHQRGEGTVLFRELGGDGEFQANYQPRFDGIESAGGRTFVAGQSAADVITRLVAVADDGYAVEWDHAFDVPLPRLDAADEYLFGVDEEAGAPYALAPSGDVMFRDIGSPKEAERLLDEVTHA
jgi:hypothetical protein